MTTNQSQMRKTGQMGGGEFGSTNLGQLTQTGNNFGAANSSIEEKPKEPVMNVKDDKGNTQQIKIIIEKKKIFYL